jgi:hypothetical protein
VHETAVATCAEGKTTDILLFDVDLRLVATLDQNGAARSSLLISYARLRPRSLAKDPARLEQDTIFKA